MNKLWSDRAWSDYLYGQLQDKKTVKKINDLIKDIERNGLRQGIGHPEPLKYKGTWSRRILPTIANLTYLSAKIPSYCVSHP